MAIERRRCDRIHAKLPVRVRFGKRGGASYEGTCINLSEKGMFAHLPSLPAAGELVLVEFELGPEPKTIRARAALAWIMPVLVGSTQVIGVGLRFIEIADEGRDVIREVTKRVERARQEAR